MSDTPELRRLSERDVCSGFNSGNDELDRFLRERAKQNQRRSQSATTLAIVGGVIAGYVTILPASLATDGLKSLVKGLPRQDVPALKLARMACDTRFQGRGIGALLLRDVVFAGALDLAEKFGCIGIYVDAKPGAVSFYAHYGFVALVPRVPGEADAPSGAPVEPARGETALTPMFLPLETLRRSVKTGG